jgi:hypothetical protein
MWGGLGILQNPDSPRDPRQKLLPRWRPQRRWGHAQEQARNKPATPAVRLPRGWGWGHGVRIVGGEATSPSQVSGDPSGRSCPGCAPARPSSLTSPPPNASRLPGALGTPAAAPAAPRPELWSPGPGRVTALGRAARA